MNNICAGGRCEVNLFHPAISHTYYRYIPYIIMGCCTIKETYAMLLIHTFPCTYMVTHIFIQLYRRNLFQTESPMQVRKKIGVWWQTVWPAISISTLLGRKPQRNLFQCSLAAASSGGKQVGAANRMIVRLVRLQLLRAIYLIANTHNSHFQTQSIF